MLAVACHFRVEALEAWPVICLPANAGDDWRVGHAGSPAQDVVRGIKAEITAEPKLVAAQPEMKIVAAGSADPFGETGADGHAAAAAKAGAHRSSAYTADPRAQAGVAKTPNTGTQAATTKAAAAEAAAKACVAKAPATEGHSPAAAADTAAACGLSRGRNCKGEGKPCHRRQKESVHHCTLRAIHAPRFSWEETLLHLGQFEHGSESFLTTVSRIWARTTKKRHWRWVAVLAKAPPAIGNYGYRGVA
jgi:hypothetical protein